MAEVAIIPASPMRSGERRLRHWLTLRPREAADRAELIAHCSDRLAHFKAPTSVELRDALDRTATGKLQKYKLRQPYWAGRDKAIN